MKPAVSPTAQASMTVIPSFHEADPMAVVWHGNYLAYFERVREVLFRAVGYSYQTMKDSGYVWPVIHAEIDYRRPMKVDVPALVSCRITEIENRLVIEYSITESGSGTLLARGKTVQMAVEIATGEGQLSSPKILFEKLGVTYPW